VTVRGSGRGGRCQEFALAAALAVEGDDGVTVLAAGTDGTDGPTDAAGALVDGKTLERARAAGLDPDRSLVDNDSHTLLAASGDLVVTGPTNTNLLDLYIALHVPAK
jgi:glycerate 2-kinase